MAKSTPTADMNTFFEPAKALNQLALDNAAKLFEMNVAVAKQFADMTFSSAREVTELKDPAAMQAFVAKQPEALKAMAEESAANAQVVMKMGMDYVQQASKVMNPKAA